MDDLTKRLAARLRALRQDNGLTLDALAAECGVSRGTLSRIETAETSPTAEVLGRLASVYRLPTSGLMRMAEDNAPRLVRHMDQEVWTDATTGYTRRAVSPPADDLAGNVVEARLNPGARVRYDRAPVAGLEHHLVMLSGALHLTHDDAEHDLRAGDCLRYRLDGSSTFHAGPDGARYLLFII